MADIEFQSAVFKRGIAFLSLNIPETYNKKPSASECRRFKNFNSRVYGFSGITGAILQAWFHWDNSYLQVSDEKKEKLTDIGFLLVFPGLGTALFKGLGFMINVY